MNTKYYDFEYYKNDNVYTVTYSILSKYLKKPTPKCKCCGRFFKKSSRFSKFCSWSCFWKRIFPFGKMLDVVNKKVL